MRRIVCLVVLTAQMFFAAAAVPGAGGGKPAAEDELVALKREYADVLALPDASKREILAIARILSATSGVAIDHTAESGEYCFKGGSAGMVHFAVHPERTAEDVVYMLDASGLIAAGLEPARMKRLPALGRMSPGVWYFLPKGEIDPHHGHAMAGPTIALALDVK
jgi:hypothetical protein